jgi:TPR repeat protein
MNRGRVFKLAVTMIGAVLLLIAAAVKRPHGFPMALLLFIMVGAAYWALGQLFRAMMRGRLPAAFLRKVAEQSGAQEQCGLGNFYYRGEGPFSQDYAQAAFWWRKAAEQGDPEAQFKLGNLYSDGQGVPQDYTQAAAWYREAAEQGSALAQYLLGDLYDKGQGLPQDYAEAYFWYALAASALTPLLAGSLLTKGPAEHRDDAASHLTPAALSREQERVRRWFEAHRAKPQ